MTNSSTPLDRLIKAQSTPAVILPTYPAQYLQTAMAHRLIRRTDVQKMIGLSRSTIYTRLDKNSPHFDPSFPKPIKLGAISVAWVESEIQEWIEARIKNRVTA